MARKPEFDRGEAVDRAIELFWAHGYQGASISALGDAMQLNPGSLYAAFGSKSELFREALIRYVERVREVAYQPQRGPRGVLEHWFATHVAHSIDVPEGSPRRGCLLLNSAAEAPELDADSAACVQSQLQALEQLFRGCVGEARRLEPRDDRPGPAATARLLLAALAGISALSRAGAEPRVLRDAARCALHLV